jgi:hypothetical protein
LTSAATVDDAFEALLADYDVAPERLREDLGQLVDTLVTAGLMTAVPPKPDVPIA